MAAQAGGGDCVCIGIRISVIVAVAVGVVHCAVGILKFELFCLFFQVGRQFSQYLGFGIRVFRMLFKGEDIFTVFFGLVYLAFQDVVEVGKKSGIYFAVRGGYLYIISFYLVQLVVVIEEPEYILPYGVAEQDFVIFLRSVGVDDEQDIEFVFADEECVTVGERENKRILLSARKLHETLEKSRLNVLPSLYHGEFSINHADLYVKELCAIVKQH